MLQLEDLPLVLTIDEAAEVLRISRQTAYEQARIWRESGGRSGLPVLNLGRTLRVPRWVLEQLLRLEFTPHADALADPASFRVVR